MGVVIADLTHRVAGLERLFQLPSGLFIAVSQQGNLGNKKYPPDLEDRKLGKRNNVEYTFNLGLCHTLSDAFIVV